MSMLCHFCVHASGVSTHRMKNSTSKRKGLEPDDYRVVDILTHIVDTFDPDEYDFLLTTIVTKIWSLEIGCACPHMDVSTAS